MSEDKKIAKAPDEVEASDNTVAQQAPLYPTNDPSQDQNTKPSKVLHIAFLVLMVGIIGFSGGWLGGASQESENSNSPAAQKVVLDKQSNLISTIAQDVGKSVVSVNVTSQSVSSGYGFFGQPRSVQQQSAGTGIVLSKDGLIITNRHVVPVGTTMVNIVMSDGTEIKDVQVVGRTNENDTLDVAFLKIKNASKYDLTPAQLGKSSDMRVGDSVVAIGNALGQFQNTVTTGIISGYGRSVQASSESGSGAENLNDLFQTDAAINQGNSGGPLVNLNGEVIGINTAVAGGDAQNIGFAIPIDNINGLIQSVSKTGKLERPYLGIIYISLTDSVASELDVSVKRGAYIPDSATYGQETVLDDGPAAKAGIKEGDVITKVGDKEINERNSLASLLGAYQPSDTVKLTINRDGKNQTIDVKLGAMPD